MKTVFLLAGLLPNVVAFAQSNDETAVKATIAQLFDEMRQVDTTAMKTLFLPTARLQTVAKNKQGDVVVRESPIAGFVASVGKAKAGALDERLSSMDVRVDGELATAWTPYVFYYNGQKSHCGVNAFTLVKTGGNWKIQHIIDTRRADNCP